VELLNPLIVRVQRWSVRIMPPGRREWAEAVWAEAGEVPARQRLRWVMGGVWLVVREAGVIGRACYWLGMAVIGAGGVVIARIIWFGTSVNPYATAEARLLISATLVLLAVLPRAGRRRSRLGPVADNAPARVIRVAGSGGICLLVLVWARLAQNLNVDFVHEPVMTGAIAMGVIIACLAVMAKVTTIGRGRHVLLPLAVPLTLFLFVLNSDWLLVVAYASLIFALTARGSPLDAATLSWGAVAGILGGVAVWLAAGEPMFAGTMGSPPVSILVAPLAVSILVVPLAVLGAPFAAGWVAALHTSKRDHEPRRKECLRKGFAAGLLTGTVASLLITIVFFGSMVVLPRYCPPDTTVPYMGMLLIGPPLGAVLGLGGASEAEHRSRAVSKAAARTSDPMSPPAS